MRVGFSLFLLFIALAGAAQASQLIASRIGTGELIRIDGMSGEVTPIATMRSLRGLAFDFRTNTMFGLAAGFPGRIFVVDPVTGMMDFVGTLTGVTNPVALAVHPIDGTLYVADNGTESLFLFDPVSGQLERGPTII